MFRLVVQVMLHPVPMEIIFFFVMFVCLFVLSVPRSDSEDTPAQRGPGGNAQDGFPSADNVHCGQARLMFYSQCLDEEEWRNVLLS